MKVLSWNCNLAFRNNFELIRLFDSDVIVIQECEKLSPDEFEGYQAHWIGMNTSKGLAVITKSKSSFERDLFREDLIYFLPVSFGETAILGVWAFNTRASKKVLNGSGLVLDAVAHYEDWLKDHKKIVIAGDFNNAPLWDKPRSNNNFVDINLRLKEIGLESTYHTFSNETIGEESSFTHFHQKNPLKKFHIDYIYSNSKNVKSFGIGEFAKWRAYSDHVPIYAELN